MKNELVSVDAYISDFPPDVQEKLVTMRETIKRAAPDAEEGFGYGMPAYKIAGRPLVYFAGFAGHIGFYATPSGHSEFSEELAKYKQGKGSVQFPLNQALPVDLIYRITLFRREENISRAPVKRKTPG